MKTATYVVRWLTSSGLADGVTFKDADQAFREVAIRQRQSDKYRDVVAEIRYDNPKPEYKYTISWLTHSETYDDHEAAQKRAAELIVNPLVGEVRVVRTAVPPRKFVVTWKDYSDEPTQRHAMNFDTREGAAGYAAALIGTKGVFDIMLSYAQ